MTLRFARRRVLIFSLISLFILSLNGCGLAVTASFHDPAETYRQLSINALSSEELSNESLQQLRIHSLEKLYQKDPEAAIAEIERKLRTSSEPKLQMTATEASFLHARNIEKKNGELAALYYIFAAHCVQRFFSDARETNDFTLASREPRLMTNFYNESVARLVVLWQTNEFSWEHSKTFSSGEIAYRVSIDTTGENVLDPAFFDTLKPAYQIKIEGLKNHYRIYGAGASLIGVRKNSPDDKDFDRFLTRPDIVQPLTAALIFNSGISTEAATTIKQELLLRFYDPLQQESVPFEDIILPLEADFSASLGVLLSRMKVSKLWTLDSFKKAFSSDLSEKDLRLTMSEPYNPEKIPVVLVHGLFSSPATYMEMLNDLRGNKRIRQNYQFWLFAYPTGLPMLFSSAKLRENLQELAQRFDPERKNPAFQNMVLVGHSMGGLLSKSLIQKNGDAAWNGFFKKPLEDMKVNDEGRELLRSAFLYDELPFIRRAVFIATPHKGSDIAVNFIGRLGSWLISTPKNIRDTTSDLANLNQDALRIRDIDVLRSGPSSIDNLAADNQTLLLYQDLPFKDDITLHSIIGVLDSKEGPGSTDGVVKYESSHLEGVESELLVHKGHSCLVWPPTIAEVKRILLEHLDQRASQGE